MKTLTTFSPHWKKTSLALTLGLMASANASAQTSVNPPPHLIASGKAYNWPPLLGEGQFGQVVGADLTPFSARGVVMEWGDTLVYAHAPTVTDLVYDLEVETTAFDVLTGNVWNGVLDRVVVSTANGLSAISFVNSETEIEFTTSAIANTSAASDAASIACADFNADGLQDIAAVCDDHQTVVVYRGTESGTFVLDSSFTQSAQIAEIQPIQWTHAAGYTGLEIAARSNLGVRVHGRTGTVLWYKLTSTPPQHEMAVVQPYVAVIDPYTTVETVNKLVVIAPVDGEDMLSVHSSSGNEAAFSLGEIDVVGVDAGDFDRDGDSDLAVSQRSDHRMYIYHNQTFDLIRGEYDFEATFSTESGSLTKVRIGQTANAPMTLNTAQPLLEDLTGDGIVDALMGVHDQHAELGGDFLYRVPGVDVSEGALDLECPNPNAFVNYNIYPNGMTNAYAGTVNSAHVVIEFEVANIWADYSNAQQLPTDVHLEVTVRVQNECVDDEITVSPILHAVYELDPTDHEAFLKKNDTAFFGFSLPGVLKATEPVTFLQKYYIEVRMVRFQNNTISGPFSSSIISCAGDTIEDEIISYTCFPRLEMANDPGIYDCYMLAQTMLEGGQGDIDYIAEAFTQSSLPPFATGPLVYPTLIVSVAK